MGSLMAVFMSSRRNSNGNSSGHRRNSFGLSSGNRNRESD